MHARMNDSTRMNGSTRMHLMCFSRNPSPLTSMRLRRPSHIRPARQQMLPEVRQQVRQLPHLPPTPCQQQQHQQQQLPKLHRRRL
jgi:hypothetical protein